MPTLIPTISIGSSSFTKLPSNERRKYSKLGTLSCISLITNKMIGTGLFSTPSIIFKYCNGDVPLFLSLWLLGALIIFSGLLIYLEFALNLPFKNGGEKNYLLRVFRKPKGLWGCIYAFQMVFLGFSSGNSFAFGKYLWYAISGEQAAEDAWISKMIGVLCITFCVWLHIKYPNQGTSLFNFLGVFKIFILFLIVAIGSLVAVKVIELPQLTTPPVPYTQSSNSYYSTSVALLEIVYSFKGWENANYVLLEISDPYHVLTIAAPLAVTLVTILYFLVVVSYLIVIPKDELLNSGVLVAGIFFNKVFGESVTSRMLPALISLLTLGNVMVVSFAHSHVNQELALNNYLPFSKYFENINHSLILHWFISVFILVAPPSSEIYEFVVNLYIYPGTWINLLICLGLIHLKLNANSEKWGHYKFVEDLEVFDNDISPVLPATYGVQSNGNQSPIGLQSPSSDRSIQSFNPEYSDQSYTEFDLLISETHSAHFKATHKSFSAPWICLVLFLLANTFLALFPFFPPPKSSGPGTIPYWCFPVVGTGCLLMGAIFYYLRAKYYEYKNLDPPTYEEDYNPEL
ncbi:CIC11C00000004283 [Sungouiella intermedia]|uniref:CIC11C00000004283 n=1 Tax=Sungouiella intermedia TaxID=45354 RepID=A0A1L0DA73_9ASCO|nr:CIC11C00000004283 [[Candida] intermedia]